MSHGTEYRLTPADEERAKAAIVELLTGWNRFGGKGCVYTPADAITVLRVGAHSLGLSVNDMRDTELEWMAATCAEAATDLGMLFR